MRLKIKKKGIRRMIWILVVLFVVMNVVAYFHAYRFTHFSEATISKTDSPEGLSTAEKISTLFFGVKNPRPENDRLPNSIYETVRIKGEFDLEAWHTKSDENKGTVLLFHGFSGQKSSLLDHAGIFNELGYNTLLVDFSGSGGSTGNTTTIGFTEATQVNQCFEYIKAKGEENIFVFGTSMGAAATLKAIKDYSIEPKGIILECPFGTMYETVSARFKIMKVPTFPMVGLLMFWGGIQNGFWAFSHNPEEYAKQVKCPTLLLHGAKDEKVSMDEIKSIYENLDGEKTLSLYPNAGHEDYLIKYEKEWTADVGAFLNVK